jgi:hypothetical protein
MTLNSVVIATMGLASPQWPATRRYPAMWSVVD